MFPPATPIPPLSVSMVAAVMMGHSIRRLVPRQQQHPRIALRGSSSVDGLQRPPEPKSHAVLPLPWHQHNTIHKFRQRSGSAMSSFTQAATVAQGKAPHGSRDSLRSPRLPPSCLRVAAPTGRSTQRLVHWARQHPRLPRQMAAESTVSKGFPITKGMLSFLRCSSTPGSSSDSLGNWLLGSRGSN